MNINIEENVITGTKIDKETEVIFKDDLPSFKGFVDGDWINFILKYPYNYGYDENGKVVAFKDEEYPGCEYNGLYNHKEKRYEGEWKIVVDRWTKGIFSLEEYVEELFGYWEIQCNEVLSSGKSNLQSNEDD